MCPNCHTELSLPSEFPGGELSCPCCNKSFMCNAQGVAYVPAAAQSRPSQIVQKKRSGMLIRKKRLTYADMKRRTMSTGYDSTGRAEDGDNGSLCFWLGFGFWLIGLIVAAIIGKGSGVKKALWGMIVSTIIWFVLGFFFGINILQMR